MDRLGIWASLIGYTHKYDPLESFKPNGLLAICIPTVIVLSTTPKHRPTIN